MHKRQTNAKMSERRLLSAQEGAAYTSLGTTTFRQWAAEIGALVRVGRLVRYDRTVIDREIEKAKTEG